MVLVVEILVNVNACPTFWPALAGTSWYTVWTDVDIPTECHIIFDILFFHFSAVPWPRSAIIVVPSIIMHFATLCIVFPKVGAFWDLDALTFQFVVIDSLTLISGNMTGRQRRAEFATMLQTERELHVISAEKEVSSALTRALFPKEIAERLTKSLQVDVTQSLPLSFQSNPSSSSYSSSSSSTISVSMTTTKHLEDREPIADSFESASIIVMTIDGMERIQPYDVQLDILSQLFIAADHVGETHDAVKIKSIGTTLIFASGVPKVMANHSEKACLLAIDLQKVLKVFTKMKHLTCLSMRIGIASGPVVAGVIGLSKPRFDVWGCESSKFKPLFFFLPVFIFIQLTHTHG